MPPIMLPYPPSANRYLRHTARGSYRTGEANLFRETVKERVWLTGLRVIHGHVGMIAELHPKLTKGGKVSKTCMDLDNALKVLCDSLQGVLYINDKQIKRIELSVGKAVDGGGLSVEVYSLC
jgi:Holliday junction resolvase RusA-like endonuclease